MTRDIGTMIQNLRRAEEARHLAAMAAIDKLEETMLGGEPTPAPTPRRRKVDDNRTAAERVWEVLSTTPRTSEWLAKKAGLTRLQVSGALNSRTIRNLVKREETEGKGSGRGTPKLYSRIEEFETKPEEVSAEA